MKKLIFTVLLLALPVSLIFAQGAKHSKTKKNVPKTPVKEIHWTEGKEPDFEDSVRKNKTPAFIYIYINGWEDVQKFNQNVLADTSIINFVDSNFVAYKVDMEYDSPNAMKFMIEGVPAIILLDQKGTEMAVLQGYHDAKEFRKFLKQRLK